MPIISYWAFRSFNQRSNGTGRNARRLKAMTALFSYELVILEPEYGCPITGTQPIRPMPPPGHFGREIVCHFTGHNTFVAAYTFSYVCKYCFHNGCPCFPSVISTFLAECLGKRHPISETNCENGTRIQCAIFVNGINMRIRFPLNK